MPTPFVRTRLALHMFLTAAVGGMYSPALAQHLDRLGFGEYEIALCCATGTIANLLTSVLAGQVADRWMSTEKFIGFLSLGAGALLVWAWTATSFEALGALLMGASIFFIPTYPLGTSMSFRHLADPAREFSGIRVWATIGWILAGWGLSGWLHAAGAVRIGDSLLFAGLLSLVNGLYSFTLPSTPPERTSTGSAVAGAFRMLREPSFAVLVGAFFAYQAFVAFFFPYVPIFLPAAGVGREWIPAVLTIGQVTEVGVVYALPAVYGRLGAKGTMALGILCWGLRYALFALGGPLWLMVAAVGLHGPGFALSRIAATLYADQVSPRDVRASAQTLLSLLVDGAGMFSGMLLAGAALKSFKAEGGGPDWPLLWAIPAAGCGAVMVALLVAFRPRKRGAGSPPC